MTTKRAHIRHVAGLTFVGNGDSQHLVTMDSSLDGGPTLATSPMEMLLVALGGCTGSDVISILQKKRLRVEGLDLHITAERSDDHPRVYTKIGVVYTIRGKDIPSVDVETAIDLSVLKYCSVSAIKKAGVEMTHDWKILPSQG